MAIDAHDYIIKLIASQADADKARAVIAGVKASLISLGDLPPVAGANVDKLNDSFATTRERIQAAKDEATALGDEIEKSFGKIEKVNGPAGLKRVGEVTSRLGGGEAGRGISTIADLANFDKIKSELSALPPTALAAGLAVGAFTVALDLYEKEQQRVKQATLADITARQSAFSLLQTGSKEEIQTKIDQLTKEKQIAEAAAIDASNLFQGVKDGVLSNLGPAAAAAEYYAATIGKASGAYQAAYDSANSARDGISKVDVELTLLEKQSGLTAQTVEDLAAAEKHRQDALYITADIQNVVNAQVEKYNAAASDSSKGLEDRQRQLQTEIIINENAIAAARYRLETEKLSQEEQNALGDSISNLTTKTNSLKTTLNELSDPFVSTSIKAREAAQAQIDAGKDLQKVKDEATADGVKEADALKSISDKNSEAFKKLGDAFKQAGLDTIAKRAEQDSKDLRTQIDADAKTKRERNDKLSDLDTQRDAKIVEAENTKNKELERIAKEFNLSSSQAIENRDAVSLQAAIDKKNADTDTANKGFDDSKKAAEKDRKDRFTALQAEFKEQDDETRIARANAARELAIARRNEDTLAKQKFQRDKDALTANNQSAINQQKSAYSKQLTDLQSYLSQRIVLDKGYMGDVLAAAVKLKGDIAAALGGGAASSPSGGGGSSSPNTHNTVPRPGHYTPTQDLDFIPGKAASTGGGVSIPITVNGQGKSAVKAQINAHIDEVWTGMGW